MEKDIFYLNFIVIQSFLWRKHEKRTVSSRQNLIYILCICWYCVVLMNRNHSWRPTPWLFPSSSTSSTFFAIATSATANNNTITSATTTTRTRGARRTASSQKIFILLFITLTLVYSIVFHCLVYILRHMAYSTKYWTPQGK